MTYVPASSHGAPVPTPGPFAYYDMSAAALASGSRFTWTVINSPSYPNNVANAALLLNLTVPTLPVVVSDGVYAISVEASSPDVHAGKQMGVFLAFDVATTDDGPGTIGIPLDVAFSLANANGVRALTAGMQIESYPNHNVGGSINLSFWALVQRII